MPLAIVFVKVALIGVISWNLTPLPIVLSDSKIDKIPFSILSLQKPIDKKGTYPFSSFANKCNRSLMLPLFSTFQRNFHLPKSFHKPIFDILNRLDIDKKGHKIKASSGDEHWKRVPFFQKKGKAFLHLLKITY